MQVYGYAGDITLIPIVPTTGIQYTTALLQQANFIVMKLGHQPTMPLQAV